MFDEDPVRDRTVRRQPAPYHRRNDRVEGSYVVVVRQGTDPADVAARAGVTPAAVFHSILNAFVATMTDQQREALRSDPDVDHVSDDAPPTARTQAASSE